ncbi:hypothetical protein K438DRAFT_1788052 [Mycena galopus ATCC 62051]|nr:hypothetical protein K438DRAFT_1788052 [Mycena galopus ATCC 62051]
MVLAQMIADSMLVGVQEVVKSLRELEASKLRVSGEGETFCPPDIGVEEFCHEYSLDNTILQLLRAHGFRKVGAICEVSDLTLKDAGFHWGEIAELRRALKELKASAIGKHESKAT